MSEYLSSILAVVTMNTEFLSPHRTLTLHRWPLSQPNASLQAWDAADELLLQHALPLAEQFSQQHQRKPHLLIIHDAFGALSCAMGDYPHTQINDSLLTQQATVHNRSINQLDPALLQQLPSTAAYPSSPDIVLLKLPSNHSYLRYILRQLAAVVHSGTQVMAAAKAKDINKNVLAIFQQELGTASASLTVKKCRLITVALQAEHSPDPLEFPLRWPLEETPFTLVNHANTFSREKLDLGARFLLQHLPVVKAGDTVIDLGCGNGVLGLCLLQQQPQTRLIFTDESFMALASAQQTISENLPDCIENCSFIADDCLAQQPDSSADYVLCNPPFHQQHAVTTHIASQMFRDAHRVLKQGGRLRIVANRHLNYAEQLKYMFGNSRLLAGNPKFVILEATKRS